MATVQTVQEKEGDWTGVKLALVRGIRVVAELLDPNFNEDLDRFYTRKDDVFVATYPRSGKQRLLNIIPVDRAGPVSETSVHY